MTNHFHSKVRWIFWMCWLGCFALAPADLRADQSSETLTLSQAIEVALEVNLELKAAQSGIEAARAAKNSQRSQFFPAFGMSYQYERKDEGTLVSATERTSKNAFSYAATVTQPVFTGYVLENRYELAKLGLDIAEVEERLTRQDVSLNVKQAFFSVLKTNKLVGVAQDTVKQIEAQKDVADNFYQVGMTPLNDLLQARVELANANQSLIVAKNNLEVAESNFNTLLRRPIDDTVNLQDILEYSPLAFDLAYCQETARQNRLETRIAELQVAAAEREIELARGGYYPTVNLEGAYFRLGDDWYANGGPGIYDSDGWSVTAVASWNFWEWGKTRHSVVEKQRRLSQAVYNRESVLDRIRLEVKEAYLRTKEAEVNIKTAEKAIEQAKENFRINQERYKEQVATNTDVLIAQTLLSQTMTNYYNALYDFQLSKAALDRAMGQDSAK